MASFNMDDTVRLQVTLKNSAGTLSDPTTLTLKVENPSGTVTTYTYALAEIVKSSTGVYYRDVSLDVSGEWLYRWKSTGTPALAAEGSLWANPRNIT